ncbi:MAG: tetratricopeptide repeat protein [Xanthomonadales bacterium]|nr:tetratricopeptide repeat protein [Xanthomonadales bacterium]
MLSACASHTPVIDQAPRLAGYEHTIEVPDADLLTVSPQMQAFLDRYVLPYENLDTRLQLLTLAVTHSGVIGFTRDDDRTLTASEAFRQRTGNCLSYANMVVALARASGLEANYQEVIVQPQWSSREDTILLAKHINVAVSSRHYRYVIDVTGERVPTNSTRHLLSDRQAASLYYNNLGVEALLDNHLPSAWAHINKAIETAPGLSSPWVNMGVVMSRNLQMHDAEKSHRNALALNSLEMTALSNLYDVYIGMGDEARAAEVEARVEKYRQGNPYYLLMLSNEAFEQGQFRKSARLLEKAVRKKDDDHALHFALARARFLTGQRDEALTAYEKARALAPGQVQSDFERALEDWVNEATATVEN